MGEWRVCKLGDAIELQRGFDLPSYERKDGIVPIYSSSGITGFHSEAKAKAPGVITGRYGTIGEVFFSKVDYWPLNTTLFVKDYKNNDELFIYYFLKNFEFETFNDKSAIPGINRNHLHASEIILPQLPEQRAIASVLSSLDEKIDLLHRQNKTLEAMAEALFRQWFTRKTSNESVILGEFAYNVRDTISVDELSEFSHYVGLEHIQKKNIALTEWGTPSVLASNKLLFDTGDILFGKLRSYFHKVCMAPFPGVCSTDILVVRPRNPKWFSFCLFWFFSEDVVGFSDLSSFGTRMPRTNWEVLSNFRIAKPDITRVELYNNICLPMLEKINENVTQLRMLITMRNNLLPKLMNAEIRVCFGKV